MIDKKKYDLWWKTNMKMMWLIVQVRSTPKLELNCDDRLDKMRSIMETKQDNNVIDHIGVVYAEKGIQLSWLIREDAIFHKKKRGQWRNRS